MATKELTLARLLDDPDSQALFNMDNVEEYRGYDIYDLNGDTTMATKLVNGGVHALHVKGIGVEYRQAMKAKIDTL
jgi:hypothetical protein